MYHAIYKQKQLAVCTFFRTMVACMHTTTFPQMFLSHLVSPPSEVENRSFIWSWIQTSNFFKFSARQGL